MKSTKSGTSGRKKQGKVDRYYLDPKGYWVDPSGNLRRMSGEQEIIATVTDKCSDAEWVALCAITQPK
jgi:hypothetical protein